MQQCSCHCGGVAAALHRNIVAGDEPCNNTGKVGRFGLMAARARWRQQQRQLQLNNIDAKASLLLLLLLLLRLLLLLLLWL